MTDGRVQAKGYLLWTGMCTTAMARSICSRMILQFCSYLCIATRKASTLGQEVNHHAAARVLCAFMKSFSPAGPEEVGVGKGVGFNINVGWEEEGAGNAEYLAAFHHLILPVAHSFRPDLVIISAGFDALCD
eukprot:SAG31_NODE_24276_length_485_cov_0.898964_1_plen_131_part_01